MRGWFNLLPGQLPLQEKVAPAGTVARRMQAPGAALLGHAFRVVLDRLSVATRSNFRHRFAHATRGIARGRMKNGGVAP